MLRKRRPQPSPDRSHILRDAVELHQRGRLGEAEKLYAAALEREPAQFDAIYLLGLLNYQRGRLADALSLVGAALSIHGNAVEALSLSGLVFDALARHAEALSSYDRALLISPTDADLLSNRGETLMRLGRHHEAVVSFDRALELRPDHPDALFNRGIALLELEAPDQALKDFERAAAINPGDAEALCNRGNALIKLNRPKEAMASYNAALAVALGHPKILTNRAHALRRLDRTAEALADLAKALEVEPDNAEAQFEESLVRLSHGDFEAGWKVYERRWATQAFARHRRTFTAQRWDGKDPVAGKTVLLHAEQGFGDTIQFVRYARLVSRLGATVILEVQPELAALLAEVEGVSAVVARGAPLPAFDLHCPLMSLPCVFNTGLATIPARIPYLAAEPARVDHWRARLPSGSAPRVGLVWAGLSSHHNDSNRSIALSTLAPLLEDSPLQFVSLQRDLREPDIMDLRNHPALVHLGADLRDFADTAAILALVDLVVTVDTAVAHLAGAMGRPTFILLPFAADFRWMRERDDSPWYPTARLFRQPTFGDWESVVTRVRAALVRTISSRAA